MNSMNSSISRQWYNELMHDAVIPKKSLGQHWLYDAITLEQIITSAGISPGDHVLEIGPGLGTLTERLLHHGVQVTAVEFDHALVSKLRHRNFGSLPASASLKVVESDILQFDLSVMPAGYTVIANIPYYLTSNLIRVLCESSNSFQTAAILIQKEVAERVCAKPGEMSILAVTTQYYCEGSLGVQVPAKLFSPPPKVDSQVLVLHRRENPMFTDTDTKLFFRIVRAGFSQKRKTLLNALTGGLAIDKAAAQHLLERAEIDPSSRAQNLSLAAWHRLYTVYTTLYNQNHE